MEQGAADDVSIGSEDEVGNEATIDIHVADLYGACFELYAFVVTRSLQIGVGSQGVTDVFAVDVDDGTLAWVEVSVAITVEFLYFIVRELQVWSQQHELSAGGAFLGSCRSGEVQGEQSLVRDVIGDDEASGLIEVHGAVGIQLGDEQIAWDDFDILAV